MKILLFGDIHGNFKHFVLSVNEIQPDLCIQVGDFGYFPGFRRFQEEKNYLKNLKCKVLWIDGNHENHPHLWGQNPIPLDMCEYVPRGTIMTISGKKFLFIGGASSIDKRTRTPGYDWFPEETIREKDVESALNFDGNVDYIITHTCPQQLLKTVLYKITNVRGMESYEDNDPSRGWLSLIYDKFKPTRWFFGHWHVPVEESNWRILSNIESEKGFLEILNI